MSTQFTTAAGSRVSGSQLNSGNFVPEVWSRKLQKKFYKTTVLDEIVNHDWEGQQ